MYEYKAIVTIKHMLRSCYSPFHTNPQGKILPSICLAIYNSGKYLIFDSVAKHLKKVLRWHNHPAFSYGTGKWQWHSVVSGKDNASSMGIILVEDGKKIMAEGRLDFSAVNFLSFFFFECCELAVMEVRGVKQWEDLRKLDFTTEWVSRSIQPGGIEARSEKSHC